MNRRKILIILLVLTSILVVAGRYVYFQKNSQSSVNENLSYQSLKDESLNSQPSLELKKDEEVNLVENSSLAKPQPEWIYSETLPLELKEKPLLMGGLGYYVVFKNNPSVFNRVWRDKTGLTAIPGKMYYGEGTYDEVPQLIKQQVTAQFDVSSKNYIVVSYFFDGGPSHEAWKLTDY